MVKIAPSILSADFANLERDIKVVEAAGADMLHVDVMDGHFVPNITIGLPVIKSLRKCSKMVFDVHLMIENPELYVEEFISCGADIVTVHAEATKHLHRLIQVIRNNNVKVGVALNPATPLNVVENVLQDIDMLLIMSVNPGFGGQKFIPNSLNKIKEARQMIAARGLNVDIQVDGGVGVDNIAEIYRHGANIMVAGSAVFNSEDIPGTIRQMKLNCEGI